MQDSDRTPHWPGGHFSDPQQQSAAPASHQPQGPVTFYNPQDFQTAKPPQQPSYQYHNQNPQGNWYLNSVPNAGQAQDPWNWPSEDNSDENRNNQQSWPHSEPQQPISLHPNATQANIPPPTSLPEEFIPFRSYVQPEQPYWNQDQVWNASYAQPWQNYPQQQWISHDTASSTPIFQPSYPVAENQTNGGEQQNSVNSEQAPFYYSNDNSNPQNKAEQKPTSELPNATSEYHQQETDGSTLSPFFSNDVYDGDLVVTTSSTSTSNSTSTSDESKATSSSSQEESSGPNSEVVQESSDSSGSGRSRPFQDWDRSSSSEKQQDEVVEDVVNREVPESPTVEEVIPSLKKLSVSALPADRVSGDGEQIEDPAKVRVAGAGMESAGEVPNQQNPPDPKIPVLPPVARIGHREGSPFKPVVKCVVQQEMPDTHEANLETEPDNLERPPDIELVSGPSLSVAHHRHHQREQYNSTPTAAALWESPELPNITLVPASPAAEKPVSDNGKGSDGDQEGGPSSRQSPLGGEGVQSVPVPVLVAPGSTVLMTTASVDFEQRTSPLGEGQQVVSRSSLPKDGIDASAEAPQNIPPAPAPSASPAHSLPPPSRRRNSHDGIGGPRQKPDASVADPISLKGATSTDNLALNDQQDYRRGYYYEEQRGSRADYGPGSVRSSREDVRRGAPWEDSRRYRSFDDPVMMAYYERERSRPPSRSSVTDHNGYPREQVAGYEHPDYHQYRRGSVDRRDYSGYDRHAYQDRYYSRPEDYYQEYRGSYDPRYFRRERSPFYSSADPYGYAYSTYDHYGYIDELCRLDPRYRERVEQYRAYYAHLGYDVSSIRSGRSSVNEELDRDNTSLAYGQELDSPRCSRVFSGYGHDVSRQSYSDAASESTKLDELEPVSVTSPARLTPARFSRPHVLARFNQKGQLIKVLPHLPSLGQVTSVEIHDIQKLLSHDPVYAELKDFPGPLIRHETHKHDVIQFCQQKIKAARESEVPDRSSVILLWELLILLLRQNGSVVGTDIAELLLKDHEILKAPVTPSDLPSQDGASPDEGIVIAQEVTKDHVTCRFREYLLFGHKKDALEWAIRHDLWGHALFLASKMEQRTYANVMARFANSLPLQDPLQTLYQLMSGRQPTAVTYVADEKWGDWRPHLAMILSNLTQRHDLDQKSITALGDTLAGRGLLHASHFCYLMAELEFGSYEQKSSKMVLLGSNHRLPFHAFATDEAIQCTEIYEYARSLADPSYVLPHLQLYKMMYAARLLDYGFPQAALHYCEVISAKFHEKPSMYPLDLVSHVYEMSCRLKYFDPFYSQAQDGDLAQDSNPPWIDALAKLKAQMQDPSSSQDGHSGISYPADNEANVRSGPVEVTDCSHQSQTAYGNDEQQNTFSNVSRGRFHQMPTDYSYAWNTTYTSMEQQQVATSTPMEQQNLGQWNIPQSVPSSEATEGVGGSDPPGQNSTTMSASSEQPAFDYYGDSVKQEIRPSYASRQYLWDQSDGSGAGDSRRGSYADMQRRDSITKQAQKKVESKKVARKDEMQKANEQTSRSWLGGIFSRLMPKAPNQMILPDDKNPSIVWDPVKCKWVNKDGDDDDADEMASGPPKDSELMSSERSAPLSAPPGPPTGNKFQRIKTRGMRQNYVDILNPNSSRSSSSLPQNLFPTVENTSSSVAQNILVPKTAFKLDAEPSGDSFVSSGQMFHKGVEPNNNEDSNANVQGNEDSMSSAPGVPMMFNPAEFATPSVSLSKPSRFQRMPYKTS